LFRRNAMASEYLRRFSSPTVKLVRFFEKSRDRWKAKYSTVKKECKKLENQTRAVEKSRENWRERARTSEQRVAELQREITQLKLRRGAPVQNA
jgi:predicted  nucleic acid-binding Zn-ribbon protein